MFVIDDIDKYLFKPFKKYCDKTGSATSQNIVLEFDAETNCICLDFGDDGEEYLGVQFDSELVTIFTGKTLETILFIKDESRKLFTSSDTWGNIVYNGGLSHMSTQEVLTMLLEILVVFYGATDAAVKKIENNREYEYFPECEYIITITNPLCSKGNLAIENIRSVVNA